MPSSTNKTQEIRVTPKPAFPFPKRGHGNPSEKKSPQDPPTQEMSEDTIRKQIERALEKD